MTRFVFYADRRRPAARRPPIELVFIPIPQNWFFDENGELFLHVESRVGEEKANKTT